ncbi:hypothetical protein C8R43DRAFT_1240369 [Mycena crocata]|nr:hypothetical protein C8R43DRAFT_1240369 [Mycena crocata]
MLATARRLLVRSAAGQSSLGCVPVGVASVAPELLRPDHQSRRSLSLRPVRKVRGPKIRGSYLIIFKEGVSRTPVHNGLIHCFDPEILNGFVARLDTSDLKSLQADPEVEEISECGMLYTCVQDDG